MIDFRYHIVSLISVFLALALGIVVGTTALNGAVLSDLRKQVKGLKSDKHGLQESQRDLQGQIRADEGFAKSVEPAVVAGRLPGRRILVVSAPGADGAVVTGVTKAIKDAGATVTAQVQLTNDYVDPRRASDLTEFITKTLPDGFSLPPTNDAGTLAGALLADVLVARQGLKQASSEERQQVLATALSGRTDGVVVAGSAGSAMDDGVVGAIRSDDRSSDKVSTVDNADRVSGQITTALALSATATSKKTGQYGTAGNASTALPSLPAQ